jgi:hypothetical protein
MLGTMNALQTNLFPLAFVLKHYLLMEDENQQKELI